MKRRSSVPPCASWNVRSSTSPPPLRPPCWRALARCMPPTSRTCSNAFAKTHASGHEIGDSPLGPCRTGHHPAVSLVSRSCGRSCCGALPALRHETFESISAKPDLSRRRRFASPELAHVRSLQVRNPFDRHLSFGNALNVQLRPALPSLQVALPQSSPVSYHPLPSGRLLTPPITAPAPRGP